MKRNAGGKSRTAGRPRSEKTRLSILRSAFQLLKERGFEDVSASQIAAQAGVSTATLYRWWNNKHAILLEAYLEMTRHLLPPRRCGRPLAQLRNYTIRVAKFLQGDSGHVFLQLLAAIQEDRELFAAFHEKVFQPRRAEGCQVVREAIAAGELPPTLDPDFVINLLISPLILRALLGQEVQPKLAQKIFDTVILACIAAPHPPASQSRSPVPPRRSHPKLP